MPFWILIASVCVSTLATWFVIASGERHAAWSSDHDTSGPQKMHAHVVPRIGGVGIAAGAACGALVAAWPLHGVEALPVRLMLAAVPAFGLGLVEDLTKNVSPARRMLAIAISAALGLWLTGAAVVRTGWDVSDRLFQWPVVVWAGTVFAVAGIVNSVNIIDGMNGLASMSVLLAMSAIAWVAHRVGDAVVLAQCLLVLGAVAGFFIWNFPRGLIFLGDGGAYLLGFMLAETGLLLLVRHPEVSPLSPFLAMFYPVFETVFTMYRRRVLSGRPLSRPDGIHLHTLLFRRVFRWSSGEVPPERLARLNSRTSPRLWLLNLVAVVPAAVFWNDSGLLAVWLVVFVCLYLTLYRRVVRFRTPAWIKPRNPT